MKRIAKFEKVSLAQFKEGCERPDAEDIYNDIKLPHRATAGSAGYDFYAPYDVKLAPGETAKIPTGIRALIEPGWVLKLYPRAGLQVPPAAEQHRWYHRQRLFTVGQRGTYLHQDNQRQQRGQNA